MLTNLVSNALKYTNEKGKVKIILADDKKHKGYWQVEVRDTGIGISEENLNKVFDKFQQIESSLSRKAGGTGLGLPIAKEFILAHRGNIFVESKENKGTSFFFTLPKYDEYEVFLTELSVFYEKSQSAKTNFGILKLTSDKIPEVVEFLEKEGKTRKIFIKNAQLFIITQNLNENLFNVYLEKLKDFASQIKNDNMLVYSLYCNFEENRDLKSLIADFERL